MTREQREALVRQSILQQLEQCGSYQLPEPALLNYINLNLTPPATAVELERELNVLLQNLWVSRITPRLGGPAKLMITDLGRGILETM